MRTHSIDIIRGRDGCTMMCTSWLAMFMALVMMSILLFASPPPANANVFGQLGKLYGCVVTWGLVCDTSETVVGTGPPVQPAQPIPVTCSQPLLDGLPQFLSWPKGSAKYRFQGICSSPARPGAFITVRWEGSWTPSETKEDRPNASETLEISGFEPFLPGRESGGKIFMFFTARCTRDPWLQSGGCTPWGAYVPDDLREAFPDIDRQSFPRTGNVMAPADKRRLYAEYLRINPPSYFSKLGLVDRASTPSRQGKYITAPPIAVDKPKATTEQLLKSPQGSARNRIEELGQQQAAVPLPYAPGVEIQRKPSSSSIFSRGLTSDDGDREETETAEAPLSVTIDRPLHVRSMGGEDVVLETGTYEVETVLDLQLSLAKEGQPSILLPAAKSTHDELLDHSIAVLVSGEADQRHLIVLRADGMRLDVIGSTSGIRSRGPGNLIALPIGKFKDAMVAATAVPSAGSGEPPPCSPNPLPTGPRWVPPGCRIHSIPGVPTSPPPPYLDGSNVLHACVNNYTGAFRIVRAADVCAADLNEVRVKWQLAP